MTAAGRRSRLSPILLLVWIAALWLAPARPAEAQKMRVAEPQVKAVFLFNFAQFVQWPETAFEAPQSAFVIGVLGDDPFGRILDDVVRGEAVGGRPLVVERYRRVEDIRVCHILFIGQLAAADDARVFAALGGRPVLTVGDSEDFAARGGVIRFVTEQSRIRLRVNMDAAKAANLTISSNLLRSAEIVGAGVGR
jgi:hypothetical protein